MVIWLFSIISRHILKRHTNFDMRIMNGFLGPQKVAIDVALVCLTFISIFVPSLFKINQASPRLDPYLNGLLIFCMTTFIAQWVVCFYYFQPKKSARHYFYMGMDMVLILTIIFDLTWVSEGIDNLTVTQILAMIRLMRLLHIVPIFTKLSRTVVDAFHGYEAQYVTNIGLKVINALISLITVMMILLFIVVTLLYTWTYQKSPFEPFTASLNFFGAEEYAQAVEAFSSPLRSEPVNLEVDYHLIVDWDPEIYRKRASVIETFENGRVSLTIDTSEMHAHLALVNLIISLVITFLMISFSLSSNIMLYQSIVRTLERIYMALNRTLALQRHRQDVAYVDQMREFFGEDQVDGDLARFESVIQSVLRLVSSEINDVYNQHPGMNSEAKQLISYLTGSSSRLKSPRTMIQRRVKSEFPRKSVDPGLGLHIREKIYTWDFDVLSFPLDSLPNIIVTMFHELHLLHPNGLTQEERYQRASVGDSFVTRGVLERFVAALQKSYCAENPYHNFHHCTDVAHATFLIITSIRKSANLSSLECYSLLIAALAHDLEHPGVNNAFLIKSKHQLALRYNDIAVLENKHASCLFEMLFQRSDINILQDMDESSWLEARKLIIHAIIHTDMAKHFSMVSRMEVRDESSFSMDSDEERLFLCAIILHAADISNPARTPTIAREWATRVLEEFFSQGDLEKVHGHAVSPMCDRNDTSLHQTQKNFIEFVVSPLYKAMSDTFPELECMHSQALQTMEYWASKDSS